MASAAAHQSGELCVIQFGKGEFEVRSNSATIPGQQPEGGPAEDLADRP
jgi:hypothetical protein